MTPEQQQMADAIRARKLEKKRETKTGSDLLTNAELDEILDGIAPLTDEIEAPAAQLVPAKPIQARPESYRQPREMIALKREQALLERELLAMTRIITELQSLEPASRVAVLARLQRAHV